jgi:hypothetical protein
MIKWTGVIKGREVVGLGLEHENVGRLQQGLPIYVMGAELGLPFDILIHYGEDAKALAKDIKEGIGPHTVIHDTSKRPATRQ